MGKDWFSHQSMTGVTRFGFPNVNKTVLFADLRKSPHQISVFPEHSFPFEWVVKPWQSLNICTLWNSYAIKKLMQLIVVWKWKSSSACNGPKYLSRMLHKCLIELLKRWETCCVRVLSTPTITLFTTDSDPVEIILFHILQPNRKQVHTANNNFACHSVIWPDT